MAAQKKIGSAIAILTLLLNPRDTRKSQRDVFNLWEALHCDRRFDRWMWVVADKFEIFELEIANVFYGGIQFHPRQGSTFP